MHVLFHSRVKIKKYCNQKEEGKKKEDNDMVSIHASPKTPRDFRLCAMSKTTRGGYNPAAAADDDDNDDDLDDDEDDPSIVSDGMFVDPRGHLLIKNQGMNYYFDDNTYLTVVPATITGTSSSSSNSTGNMNKMQRSSA